MANFFYMWKVVAMHGSYSGPAMCSHKTKQKKKSFFRHAHYHVATTHLRLGSTAPDFKADTVGFMRRLCQEITP